MKKKNAVIKVNNRIYLLMISLNNYPLNLINKWISKEIIIFLNILFAFCNIFQKLFVKKGICFLLIWQLLSVLTEAVSPPITLRYIQVERIESQCQVKIDLAVVRNLTYILSIQLIPLLNDLYLNLQFVAILILNYLCLILQNYGVLAGPISVEDHQSVFWIHQISINKL